MLRIKKVNNKLFKPLFIVVITVVMVFGFKMTIIYSEYKYNTYFNSIQNVANTGVNGTNNKNISYIDTVILGRSLALYINNDINTLIDTGLAEYELGLNLLKLDLVRDLSGIDDKKSFLNDFLLEIGTHLNNLKNLSNKIDSKILYYTDLETYLNSIVKENEDLILQKFTDLDHQNLIFLIQDSYFPNRTKYLNIKTYLALYTRLGRGVDNLIEVLDLYKTEIIANIEPLSLGVRVVKFDNARLKLIINQNEQL